MAVLRDSATFNPLMQMKAWDRGVNSHVRTESITVLASCRTMQESPRASPSIWVSAGNISHPLSDQLGNLAMPGRPSCS